MLAPTLLTALAVGLPPYQPGLTGSWTLTQIAPRGELITPGTALKKPTLNFASRSGRTYGHTGCHSYSATVSTISNHLVVKNLTTIGQNHCTDYALGLEADYLELLRQASRYEVNGTTLTLYADQQRRLIFEASKATQPSLTLGDLAGEWSITAIKLNSKSIPASHALLTLKDLGNGQLEVQGNLGCNQLLGRGKLTGNTLRMEPLATTLMSCDNMAAEDAFGKLLKQPLKVQFQRKNMLWSGAGGELTLQRALAALDQIKNKTYVLASINGDKPPTTNSPITLRWREGQVGGNDGCNFYGGLIDFDLEERLVIEELTSTTMSCPGMQYASSLLSLLEQRPRISLNEGNLHLDTGNEHWVFQEQ